MFRQMCILFITFPGASRLSLNFSGNSTSPAYNQLQPVTDFSNASFPVTGNPYLKPQYRQHALHTV